MGNKSSAPVAAENSGDDTGSGIALSSELQSKIVQDFNDVQVQQEYIGFQRSMLEERRERAQSEHEINVQFQREVKAWQKMDKQRQEELDNKIDDMNAQFFNSSAEINHEASRLEEKIAKDAKIDIKEEDCFNSRMNLASCFKINSKNLSECNGFVEILEQCVKKTIVDAH
mmetsp:Transcript_20467/g.20750  ORF Transcript_20467/g.20750 Transcript_20467/m.20750 type:complete len:171 (-) Transcript_20467:257-769(-)